MTYIPPKEERHGELDSLVVLYQQSENEAVFELLRVKLHCWLRKKAEALERKIGFPGGAEDLVQDIWQILIRRVIPDYDYRQVSFILYAERSITNHFRGLYKRWTRFRLWFFDLVEVPIIETGEGASVIDWTQEASAEMELPTSEISDFLEGLKPPILRPKTHEIIKALLEVQGKERGEALTYTMMKTGLSQKVIRFTLADENLKNLVSRRLHCLCYEGRE